MEHGAAIALLVVAVVAGFYMAWNIGANDVANAMGTSVGSGALTYRKAMLVAGLLEFSGAVLVGMHVTETVRKKMLDPTTIPTDVLMIGMVASLLGAGTWLLIATALGRPVSTTHSIVGAIFGFGLMVAGVHAVNWSKIGEIVVSWVVSPLMSGAIAYLLFSWIEAAVIKSVDPVSAARRWFPAYVFLVFFVMVLVTIFKGLANLRLDLTLDQAVTVAVAIGLVAAAVGGWLIRRAEVPEVDETLLGGAQPLSVERGLADVSLRVSRLRGLAGGPVQERLASIENELVALAAEANEHSVPARLRPEYRFVERAFGSLQVLSACFVAFAHGSNDVANAVGPLAAVVTLVHGGREALAGSTPVPFWVLVLGATGIVVGLATFGRRVMQTIGTRITDLTPSRGFSAEVAAASTIVLASRLGLPVSTTHTLVGGVLGVGLARGIANINPTVVREIMIAWAIEVPAAAGLCVLFYGLLQLVF